MLEAVGGYKVLIEYLENDETGFSISQKRRKSFV